MRQFLMTLIVFLPLIAAAAKPQGPQVGMVCEDEKGARYLFSDGHTGEGQDRQNFSNATVCLAKKCNATVLRKKGTFDNILFPEMQMTGTDLATVAGPDLRLKKLGDMVLVCGAREPLEDVQARISH